MAAPLSARSWPASRANATCSPLVSSLRIFLTCASSCGMDSLFPNRSAMWPPGRITPHIRSPSSPASGKRPTRGEVLLDVVLAAKVLHALRVDLQKSRRRCLLPAGPAQRGIYVGHFDAFHFGVKIHAGFRNQDGFLTGGARIEKILRQVFGRDGRLVVHDHQSLDNILQ